MAKYCPRTYLLNGTHVKEQKTRSIRPGISGEKTSAKGHWGSIKRTIGAGGCEPPRRGRLNHSSIALLRSRLINGQNSRPVEEKGEPIVIYFIYENSVFPDELGGKEWELTQYFLLSLQIHIRCLDQLAADWPAPVSITPKIR